MTDIRIIKAAPVPPAKPPRGSKSRYPLLDLEIGDSFVVGPEHAGGVRTSAYQIGKLYGVKFTTRTLDDGSVQVWRVRK
jgi:hypothetical protein